MSTETRTMIRINGQEFPWLLPFIKREDILRMRNIRGATITYLDRDRRVTRMEPMDLIKVFPGMRIAVVVT